MSVKRLGCLNHILQHTTHCKWETKRISYFRSSLPLCAFTVKPSIYQVEVISFWPLATIEGAESHYMHDEDMLWVWSGWGASIITHNLQHDTSEKPSETPTFAMWMWNKADISVGLHPNEHWPDKKTETIDLETVVAKEISWAGGPGPGPLGPGLEPSGAGAAGRWCRIVICHSVQYLHVLGRKLL
jgi:hypothetical protein